MKSTFHLQRPCYKITAFSACYSKVKASAHITLNNIAVPTDFGLLTREHSTDISQRRESFRYPFCKCLESACFLYQEGCDSQQTAGGNLR